MRKAIYAIIFLNTISLLGENLWIQKSGELNGILISKGEAWVEVKEDSLSDVSEKVKRRIDKLTFKIRESERREKAALDYAKGLKNQLDDTKTRFSKTIKIRI